jgi:2-succinyl-5-enolpyruvyl-6-hydroxy-3-cyclohexene-1-carboxylate synthase
VEKSIQPSTQPAAADELAREALRRSTYSAALAFFAGLSSTGLRHVCVSPGSRSAPLAVSAALLEDRGLLRSWVHIDERAAAFFALGMAKTLREPVALVCTSGTAAANYLPAIIEARFAGVPLVVLTADRPPELRDRGAGQTIEQVGLYGANVRWFHDTGVPDPNGLSPRSARSLAARAVAEALGRPRGAVHLNWPLREPLDPPRDIRELLDAACDERSATRLALAASPCAPSEDAVETLAGLVRVHERGVIACGPNDEAADLAAAVGKLARTAGWPLLAEPTSGTRSGEGLVLARSDLFLRDERFAAAHRPDVVVRIGRSPTSKSQRLWLEAAPPLEFVLVDPDRAWNDAGALATRWIEADPALLCRAVTDRLGSLPPRRSCWQDDFLAAERIAETATAALLDGDKTLLAPRVVCELAAVLPPDAWLYVSNSMAVRDVDAFWPVEARARRVLSSRGASGIDGVTSSALGAAAASGQHGVLLTGDLAFLHDVGGLLAARRHGLAATIVVLDDDGGGIFSYLPIAAHAEAVRFESLFRTPHGVDLRAAAELAGAHCVRVDGIDSFRSALAASFQRGGLTIVVVPIDAAANVAQHRAIETVVKARLAGLVLDGAGAR